MKKKSSPVTLASLVCRDRIFLLSCNQKNEVIDFLFNTVAAAGVCTDSARVYEALQKREQLMPTGVGCGIALPHVGSHLVKRFALAIGILQKGIPWGGFDAIEVRIVVCIIYPSHERENYLQLIAQLSSILKNPDCRCKILSADNTQKIADLFLEFPL